MRGFAFTMLVGIIIGTYSTIYIAAPIVVWWDSYRKRQRPPTARAGPSSPDEARANGPCLALLLPAVLL